MPAPKHS